MLNGGHACLCDFSINGISTALRKGSCCLQFRYRATCVREQLHTVGKTVMAPEFALPGGVVVPTLLDPPVNAGPSFDSDTTRPFA